MQQRFIKYRDPINSFEANEKYTGIIEPGIYRGFDQITNVDGLTLTLSHGATGEIFTNKDGTTQTSPRAVWMTKQGLIIKESSGIAIEIEANPNNYERWDILVGVHLYDELNPGGVPASYEVITGGNNIEPTLTTPLSQTILGRIRVPANATTGASVIWERRRIKQLGGKDSALLDAPNRFTGQNQEHQALTTILNDSDLSKFVINSLEGANSFVIESAAGAFLDLLPNKPAGTTLSITFGSTVTIRGFGNQVTPANQITGYTLGYRAILIDPQLPSYSLTVYAGDAVTLRKVNTTWAAPTQPFGDYWVVTAVTSNISTRRIAERDSIEYINTDFLGIRYNASGGTYVTDGLLKKLDGPDVQEVITLSPPILPGNSNGIIKGRVYGSSAWNYNGAPNMDGADWPSTSNNRLIMEIQGIELVLVQGAPPTAPGWMGTYVGFEFEIKMLRGVPTIMYKQQSYGVGGGVVHLFTTGPIAQPHHELIDDYYSMGVTWADGWFYKPLPTLNMTNPIEIKFKTPLMPVSLTATQYSQWVNQTQRSNLNEFRYNALRLVEFKVIRL